MQCVRVVQLNGVKVQCMLCEWECDVGELFVTVTVSFIITIIFSRLY